MDFWLISDHLLDSISNTRIVPAIHTDHNAVLVELKSSQVHHRGRGLWKLNSKFVTNKDYVAKLLEKLDEWKRVDFTDPIIRWEYLKYKIRDFSIAFSREYWKEKNEKIQQLENELERLESEYAINNTDMNLELLENTKLELEQVNIEKAEGAIIRARVKWHEYGEKSNKYFLNMEKNKQSKKNIRELNVEGRIITDQKGILSEQAKFYENLYTSKGQCSDEQFQEFTEDLTIPRLENEEKQSCEGLMTIGECGKVIKTMKNNKSPGNDGITIEFHKIFWPHIGNIVVNSFNAAHACQTLSTSQRQAVITLIDKPGKD